ncbi:MAG: hypothetical protein AAF798_18130 [Bacteroidota bacterium]
MKRYFSDFAFMADIDLGEKFNMSYRLRSLLNEKIDLPKYGKAIQYILISPIIGSVLTPESEYISHKKELDVEFEIDPQVALDLNAASYFRLMRDGFLRAMEAMELPEDFDFVSFKADVQALRFEQLRQAA